MLKSSSVSGEIYSQERTDGSQSDTALGMVCGSSLSARVVAIVGNRRSRSTSQISGPGECPRGKCERVKVNGCLSLQENMLDPLHLKTKKPGKQPPQTINNTYMTGYEEFVIDYNLPAVPFIVQ